jgi:hypothetical protein
MAHEVNTMPATATDLTRLSEPTPDLEKKTRPAPGGSGKMLTYIDARYVMDTLDKVVGPSNWQNRFALDANGNLTCGIGINVDGEWVWKWDVGTESSIEATKGNFSDAFKRAGVHWGIARDLYDDRSAVATFRVAGSGSAGPSAGSVGGGPSPALPAGLATAPLVSDWSCPIHGTYKVIPAGVSTRTGKPYPAFVACPERGCEQKPGRGQSTPKPAPVYVGMSEYPVEEDDFGSMPLGDYLADSGNN